MMEMRVIKKNKNVGELICKVKKEYKLYTPFLEVIQRVYSLLSYDFNSRNEMICYIIS